MNMFMGEVGVDSQKRLEVIVNDESLKALEDDALL